MPSKCRTNGRKDADVHMNACIFPGISDFRGKALELRNSEILGWGQILQSLIKDLKL